MENASEKNFYLNPWVTLVESQIENEDEFYYHLKVPDYVYILSLTDDGQIPLVKQYRIPLNRHTLELPAGLIENDQTPGEAAIKELNEETGIEIFRDLIAIPPMVLDSGRIANTTYGYIATGVEKPKNSNIHETGLEVVWVSKEKVISLAESGLIDHMGQVALILWASRVGYL